MKSGIYGLRKVPKNRILFLLFNSLVCCRCCLESDNCWTKIWFLGTFLRSYIRDFKLERLYKIISLVNNWLIMQNFHIWLYAKFCEYDPVLLYKCSGVEITDVILLHRKIILSWLFCQIYLKHTLQFAVIAHHIRGQP